MKDLPVTSNAADVCLERMPEHARRQMACMLYDWTLEWFQDPAVQEAYERWLPEFRKREAARLAAEGGR